MAPLPLRDAARARQDLIALASNPSRERWVIASRYALGVLDEQAGQSARCLARSRASLSSSRKATSRRGRGPASTHAFSPRSGLWRSCGLAPRGDRRPRPACRSSGTAAGLALREVLRDRRSGGTYGRRPFATAVTTRGASLLATAADGRLVVFDRKNGAVQEFDLNGQAVRLRCRWPTSPRWPPIPFRARVRG